MQNYKIPRTEILKLYESCLKEVSAHSVGQWLKSVTEKQFVVIPREEILHLCHAFDDIEESVLTIIKQQKIYKNGYKIMNIGCITISRNTC